MFAPGGMPGHDETQQRFWQDRLSPSWLPPDRVSAPSPLQGQVRAHVQVLVTDEALFATSATSSTAPLLQSDATADPPDVFEPRGLPPELAAYGPIDAASARDLAADAGHWELIRRHPGTGAIVSVDRYRPSEEMRRLLRARDQHCRFPGCRAPLARCDLDHTVDAALGGPTATNNLAFLCRGHHTLKHHGGWRVRQKADGDLDWQSPTGRQYRERPPSAVRFSAATTVRFAAANTAAGAAPGATAGTAARTIPSD